ncbi:putative family protein [Botrytis cinerea BcDW1]|uniref:Putative family protein n=1 Tax=Botryotinia fuckeliana (strain BcDW1) TaxID=1290391 RepID=M7TPN2_BOTF1|nr:putative family protein [Botrytis cinerea BcDW1]
MSSHQTSKIFIIGGTGAQGIPVIKSLVADKKYQVRVLTRDTTSTRAQQLLALGNVELFEGTFADEDVLRAGYKGCDGAFINIDGFNTGEKTEMFWAIRSYEIAIQEGIKFFVYGNLDYGLKKSGWQEKYHAGHYDGKGRIGEWILWQNQSSPNGMGAALFTTGPYMEMTTSGPTLMSPSVENDVVTWRVPLGDGAVPHVSLEDCGPYVRWLFDHSDRSNGMDLAVAIANISYSEMATAFEKVTGHPAQYIDTEFDTFFERFGPQVDAPAGFNADPKDKATMTFKRNFTGFWMQFRDRVLDRDYKLLDEIHPGRIRSAEEFFRREEERLREESGGKTGLWESVQEENLKFVLKVSEDGWKGKL